MVSGEIWANVRYSRAENIQVYHLAVNDSRPSFSAEDCSNVEELGMFIVEVVLFRENLSKLGYSLSPYALPELLLVQYVHNPYIEPPWSISSHHGEPQNNDTSRKFGSTGLLDSP